MPAYPVVSEYTDGEDTEELKAYAQSIMRPLQKGDLENMLSSEMFVATLSTDPLGKIRHIMEAYRLLNEQERMEITSPDAHRTMCRIYTMCLSLLNIKPCMQNCGAIPLRFAVEQAYLYINFLHDIEYDLSDYYGDHWARFMQEKEESPAFKQKYYENLARYLRSTKASLVFCTEVKIAFIDYAMPLALELLRHIFSRFLGPEAQEEFKLSIMGRAKKRAQKEGGKP